MINDIDLNDYDSNEYRLSLISKFNAKSYKYAPYWLELKHKLSITIKINNVYNNHICYKKALSRLHRIDDYFKEYCMLTYNTTLIFKSKSTQSELTIKLINPLKKVSIYDYT